MTGEKLKLIADLYDTAVSGGDCNTCVCVHGRHGTGKSSLLEKLGNTLLMRGANVYFSTHNKQSDGALKELLRQLARTYGEGFDPEFIKFITSFAKGTLSEDCIDVNSDIKDSTASPYEKDSLLRFIYNCISKEPTVFIVDDLDKAGFFTINLIGNLLALGILQFLVFSHSDKLENDLLTGILFRNAKRITYVELKTVTGQDGTANPSVSRDDDAAHSNDHVLSSFDGIAEADFLLKTGSAALEDGNYKAAAETLISALQLTDTQAFPDKRAAVSVQLGSCCLKQGMFDKARDYIMLAEAFFILPEHRTQYYGLYKQHICQYLNMLSEMNERVIFREKLKQAHSVCLIDDSAFTGSLYCAEAFMLMECGDYEAAKKLLLEAKELADETKSPKLHDTAVSSLALCADNSGELEESLELWKKLIDSSLDPIISAEAMINTAIVGFRSDEDAEKAISLIHSGIALYTLAGAEHVIDRLRDELQYSPLSAAFNG